MPKISWSPEDANAFREFLRRVPKEKISAIMRSMCPAVLDSDIVLKNDAESISRIASMKSGWEEYEERFFALADPPKRESPAAEYRDMT